jgi:hypothetical protein
MQPVPGQQIGNHVPTATNTRETIKEGVFYVIRAEELS